ncbi:MAG: energy-coupling factor transporter transmembrane protein EcfT [Lachnospiraceae bacterium]|nr:energy-coupling factor transporter transmembrane protein EcfT [Lachnospiraceae bacterium]
MTRLISYEKKDTWIHRLSGFTKLVFFLVWCITSALTFDTRVLVVMLGIGVFIFLSSATKWKQVDSVFRVILFFMVLNLLFIFLFSPYEGTKIYGTRTELAALPFGIRLTAEQLFYEFNVMLKYFTVVPGVFIFLVTTDPSEFAASLNGVGIPYSVSYAVAITLRYIPDVQDDYRRIRNAQEARGLDMSVKAKLMTRIRRVASIIFPLLFSTMEKIEVVSNAMELRGFGKRKKRSWYAKKPLTRTDKGVIAFVLLFMAAAMIVTWADGSRFYNPFQ